MMWTPPRTILHDGVDGVLSPDRVGLAGHLPHPD
jgi:hypothetical protein